MVATQTNKIILNDGEAQLLLSVDSPEVIERLVAARDPVVAALHMLEVGAAVLNRAAASSNLDYVEKRFDAAAHSMEAYFQSFQAQLQEYIRENFDPHMGASFTAKAVKLLAEQHSQLKEQVRTILDNTQSQIARETGRLELGQSTLDRKLDPDNKAGYLGRLIQQIESFDHKLLQQFSETDKASFVGKLNETIAQHFGSDGLVLEQIRGLISLDKGTALAEMYEGLRREVSDLRDTLMRTQGQQELVDKTTVKGYPFESRVFDRLQSIAQPYSDLVEDLSLIAEAVSGSKKGDYTYTLASSSYKIVIDAKNYSKLKSLKAMLKYLDEALEQRSSQVGIIVVPDQEALQKQIGEWNYYEGNKIVTTLDYLEISIKFAKYIIGSQTQASDQINLADVKSSLEFVQTKMKDISILKGKLTKLANGVTGSIHEIQEMLDTFKNDVNTKLEELSAQVF